MSTTPHNPATLFPRYSNHHHAVEVRGDSRLLFISGLNGYLPDGKTMPLTFDDQAEIIWGHLKAILAGAGMTVQNLVSMRFYLADPQYDEANVRMRAKHLGEHAVSLTVVCCQLLDPKWKLEIEAVAAT
jgi:enamine deaminase RidA (YjgF/YER057c/UK114 family)